jgi:hypothetical protein
MRVLLLLVPLLCYVQFIYALFKEHAMYVYAALIHGIIGVKYWLWTAQEVPSVPFPSCQRCISVQGNGMGSSFAIIISGSRGVNCDDESVTVRCSPRSAWLFVVG